MISLGGILPAAAIVIVTTGLIDALLIRYVKSKTKAYAAPMAKGLPVESTIYTQKREPKNSAKYAYILFKILFDYIIFYAVIIISRSNKTPEDLDIYEYILLARKTLLTGNISWPHE